MTRSDREKYIPLPSEEVARLTRAAQAGGADAKDAAARLVEANIGLVTILARGAKYRHRAQMAGLTVPDLVAEGTLGLHEAVKTFRPDCGFKFTTHAKWRIMAAFEDALAGTRQVRLAPNVATLVNKMRQVNKTFMQTMWREPRIDELARELGVDVATAEQLQVTELTPLSFDAQLYGGEEGPASSLEDFMASKLPGPDEMAMAKQATERTAKALEVLNPKELRVLQLRYAARTDYTLAAVGKELGITAERVRQIEEKALQKLRAYSPEADAFKEMLGTIVGDLLPPCQ